MNSEKDSQSKLIDVLSPNTTRADFEKLVSGLVTDKDRKMFGKKAEDLITQSILYPAVFAPYPASIGTDAYAFVIDDAAAAAGYEGFIDTDRIDRLLTITLESGVLEMNEDGRLVMPEGVQEKILPILEKYDEEEPEINPTASWMHEMEAEESRIIRAQYDLSLQEFMEEVLGGSINERDARDIYRQVAEAVGGKEEYIHDYTMWMAEKNQKLHNMEFDEWRAYQEKFMKRKKH